MADRDSPSATKRPNVILITTDQQRGDCVGYDTRGVNTPHKVPVAPRVGWH